MTHNILRFIDVTVRYWKTTAVEHLTAEVECNSLTALAGPNGAGKSTLLKAILGWCPLSTGKILVGDAHAHHARPRIAYLPQRAEIDWDFPITVADVVSQGRYPIVGSFGKFKEHDYQYIDAAIREMGLQKLAKRPLHDLSSGQQQRVFLARALAQGADIFLLDEPFNGLDLQAIHDLIEILKTWHKQGRTVLAVIHDLTRIKSSFSHVLLLNTILIAYGATDTVLTAENLYKIYDQESHSLDTFLETVHG